MPSLMNGLSALGAGVSAFAGTAGLEYQKSQLANQSAILADQLATTRETKLQGQQQTFQSGENVTNRAATAANLATTTAAENQRNAATIAGTAANNRATIAAEAERQRVGFTAPTELEKTFRFLKLNPDGTPIAGAPTPDTGAAPTAPKPETAPTDSPQAPVPVGNLGLVRYADGSVGTPMAKASDATTGPSGPTPSAAASPAPSAPASGSIGQRLIDKATGMPMAGSPEATRYAIAQDVKVDPAFKYKTAGQQAAEVELRVAIAEGKMTSPEARQSMAEMIAGYQLPALENYALTKPGAPETMGLVRGINPDYSAARFPEINKAVSAFGTGKQGDTVRSLNVGVQHLDVLDQAAAALANGNINAINSLKNVFQQQFGAPAPTTFDGLKQIVGTEIEKAVAGGIGSSADRDRLQAALDRARSPAQLQAMTDGFRGLMAGQLVGLKQQYEEATGFKGGPFAFESKLVPATVKAIGAHSGDATAATTPAAPASATPAAPQTIYTDSGPVDVPAPAPAPAPAPITSSYAPGKVYNPTAQRWEDAPSAATARPAPRATPTAQPIIRYDATGNRISP